MDSLYGGKPGNPFVIKQAFPTIEAMVAEFAKGAGSNKVWYGEYCIIDTINKNDKTNGCIYRRGYTGPEYIGQIVGPKGGQGNFAVKSIEEVAEYMNSSIFSENGAIKSENYRNYPTYNEDGTLGWNWVEDKDEKTFYDRGYPYGESGDYFESQPYRNGVVSDVAIQEFNTKDKSLVPGKEADGTFNDTIRWNYCNVRLTVDKDGNVPSELDTWMYVGFEFPYSVFEFEATKVEHYENAAIVEKEDSKEHPYYWHYNFDVPKGRPGQDLVKVWAEPYDDKNEEHLQAVPENERPAVGKYIWLYQVKNYENETASHEPDVITKFGGIYHGEFNFNVVNMQEIKTTTLTTPQEYLDWLNGGQTEVVGSEQYKFTTCLINGVIYGFVYDAGEWKYAGSISSADIHVADVNEKTYSNLFFKRS